MGQSCIDVDPNQLDHMVRTLQMIGITVTGSQQADGVVRLVIVGDIVLDADLVTVQVETMIGSIYSQITARCVPCLV